MTPWVNDSGIIAKIEDALAAVPDPDEVPARTRRKVSAARNALMRALFLLMDAEEVESTTARILREEYSG